MLRLWLPALLWLGCAHAPSVDVADQSLIAARVALDQSQKYRNLANRELDAAKARVEAAHDHDLALRELFAARARKDYAERVVDLRRAEIDLRRAEIDLRRDERTYANQVAADRRRVAVLAGSVEQLRIAWMERDQEYRTASREHNPPTFNPPPSGGANEGPAAPESLPQD
jgi:hypothetical protein